MNKTPEECLNSPHSITAAYTNPVRWHKFLAKIDKFQNFSNSGELSKEEKEQIQIRWIWFSAGYNSQCDNPKDILWHTYDGPFP